MSYVVPLGIPHSEFLGWSELDQSKAIEWRREQNRICATCRTRREEWERDRDAHIGHIEQCPGCERLEQEQENAANMQAKGLKIGLLPKHLASSGEDLAGG